DDLIIDEDSIQIPRHEILRNAFVLKPLHDLVPDLHHPQCGKCFAELWRDMAADAPKLDVVKLPQLSSMEANACTSC
ncbi:MAG: hypothetical protein GY784_02580, partial [Gammaproteobacteria bacterium]|nr:hypothetical protein [Gammaproteobacteria bacterium]